MKKIDSIKFFKSLIPQLILLFIYVLPIIIANIYYNDDLARSFYGATGWKGDGRPLAELLIVIMSWGTPIVDMAPLYLIIAIIVFSISITLYSESRLDAITSRKGKILILSLAIMHPFSLQTLSYRYDCIFMYIALSIPFIVMSIPDLDFHYFKQSAYFNDNIKSSFLNYTSNLLVMLIATIIMLSLYQPAICMMLILLLLDFSLSLWNKEIPMAIVLFKAFGIFIGSILYKIVIANHFVDKQGWRSDASSFIPVDGNLLNSIIINIKASTKYIIQGFTGYSKNGIIIFTIFILLICFLIFIKTKNIYENGLKSFMARITLTLSPFVAFALIFLPLTVLNSFTLKNRIFLSFGGFLIYLIVFLIRLYPMKASLILSMVCIYLFSQYTLIYSYGNALKSQNEYQKYMAYNIVHDIETINYDGNYNSLSFVGNMPKSRQVQMLCEKNPLFADLVPVYFTNDPWIGGVWVYHYMQDGINIVSSTDEDLRLIDSQEPLLKNYIYSCYGDGEKILVVFN